MTAKEYFNGDELAQSVWESKYKYKDEQTPDDMHKRMAKEFAKVEDKYNAPRVDLSDYGRTREPLTEDKIYELFKDFKYVIPQGSIMASLGTDVIASLSNCYTVESPYDSYAGINKTDGDLIYYYKRRGGVGVDISTLRPANTPTKNTAKTSTGVVSFMPRFSNTTREVSMFGRRGALLCSMDIRHPDILDFVKVKRDLTSVTGANISVKITDEFMHAVTLKEDFILRYPIEADISVGPNLPYNTLVTLDNGVFIKKIKAKEYWDELIKSATGFGEPGILFVDNANNGDPSYVYEQYRAVTTNP